MSERVRIPSDLNEEDVFFSFGPIKMSIRQLLLIFGGVILWYLAGKYILGAIGIGLAFGMIASVWIPLVAFAFAFVQVAGRPLDVWIAEKLAFTFGARTYVMRAPDAKSGIDANLDRDEDMEALLDYRVRERS